MTEAQATRGEAQQQAAPHQDAIGKILTVGAMFDMLTPIMAAVLCAFFGYVHFCAYDNGSSTWAGLHYVLREKGIKSRWPQILGTDQYHINVPRAQARYAMYIMDRDEIRYRGSGVAAGSGKRGGSSFTRAARAVKRELFN